jgi:hypothetical protein
VRRIYPQKERILFDGGLNSKYARSVLLDNESPDCANVVFKNGAVETREGVTKLNAISIGSFVGDGLYTRRDDTGAETMVVFAGGTMWQLGGSTFTTVASAQSVFTAGIRVAAAQYENRLFAGNGGVTPYKYDGANFTRHGVYPPTTTMTVASNGAGNLTASSDYRYKVTFVNSIAVEGDVGPVTATFTISATSGQIRLTSIPVAPQSWGVNSRRVYRTAANGSTFKRVTEISNNTATTFDDNVADAALGANAPTDNGVPPLYSCIVYHQNRLFMNDPSNPNYVWFTNLGEPYTVASTNFIKVGDAASDLVKALSVYNDHIVAWCEKSAWVIYMPDTDSANWKQIRIKSPFGSKSPFGIIDYNNRQLFPAVQNGKFVGFAAIAGDMLEPSASLLTVSSAGGELRSDRIEPDMYDVQEAYQGNISAIVFKNRAFISVTDGASSTMNNKIWMMDFSLSNAERKQKEAWAPWTGLNAAQFTIYNGDLYYVSSTATGFVHQMESGVYNDDGVAIDSYFWTKEFGGYEQDLSYHKDFRFTNILVDKAGSYYMTINARTNSDAGNGSTYQVDLSPGGSLWGVMVWGTDTWGGAKSQEDIRVDLGTANGERVQFQFTNQNTANQRFKVYWQTFTYNLKGAR